jgi:hypothetical protein
LEAERAPAAANSHDVSSSRQPFVLTMRNLGKSALPYAPLLAGHDMSDMAHATRWHRHDGAISGMSATRGRCGCWAARVIPTTSSRSSLGPQRRQ